MSSGYYQRVPDNDHVYANAPSSPLWKASRRDVRRRPLHFRQAAFVVASVIFTVSLFFFYQTRDNAHAVQVQGLDIPTSPEEPFHPRPAFDYSHQRIPHHAHIPDISTITTTASEPEATPVPSYNASLAQSSYDPVTFSLIMFSEDSAAEGAILMKVRVH